MVDFPVELRLVLWGAIIGFGLYLSLRKFIHNETESYADRIDALERRMKALEAEVPDLLTREIRHRIRNVVTPEFSRRDVLLTALRLDLDRMRKES